MEGKNWFPRGRTEGIGGPGRRGKQIKFLHHWKEIAIYFSTETPDSAARGPGSEPQPASAPELRTAPRDFGADFISGPRGWIASLVPGSPRTHKEEGRGVGGGGRAAWGGGGIEGGFLKCLTFLETCSSFNESQRIIFQTREVR